ncbi:MAG: hypothetical protein GY798_31585 [Hyphomicrobiales bacterium]|nr:hypothetical protein [Hyphomicrobiales bacterium]
MRTILLLLALAATPALAVDFSDFDEVCTITAEATGQKDKAAFHAICTCAYDVIAEKMGDDLAVIYARFELKDGTLDELLPASMSSEDFFARIGEIGPDIDAACSG